MASLYLNPTPPNPAWLSPALSVIKSAGLDQDAGTPILDVDPLPPSTEYQQIRAVAGNDTTSTFANVHVQIWAMAFGTAPASNLFLSSMGGPLGISIPAGGAMPIDIGPAQQQPFARDWDATYGLATSEPEIQALLSNGEIHCCILGNVHHPNDAGSAAITDPAGPLAHLDVVNNRRHAQRNMTIKTHDAQTALAFNMFAANPDPEQEQAAVLQIEERLPRELQAFELAELDALGPWIRRGGRAIKGGIPGLEIMIDGKPRALQAARKPLKRLELDVADAGGGQKVKVQLGPDEARPMHIHADLPDEEFVLRVLDIKQTRGRETVGGARVMLLTVPKELLKPRGTRTPA